MHIQGNSTVSGKGYGPCKENTGVKRAAGIGLAGLMSALT